MLAATGDADLAVPFAAGGAVGLTYLGFLGKYVDVLGPQGGASGAGALSLGRAGRGAARCCGLGERCTVCGARKK